MNTKPFALGIAFVAMMLATVLSAANADAFRIGNYDIGAGGIQKIVQEQIAAETKTQEKAQEKEQERIMTAEEIGTAIGDANNDDSARLFMMRHFAGKHFCVHTESRTAYLQVAQNGIISLESEKPASCHTVRTTEEYILQKWQEYEDTGIVTMDDAAQNIQSGLGLRARFAFAKASDAVTGLFS